MSGGPKPIEFFKPVEDEEERSKMGRFLFLAALALALISCNDSGTSTPDEVDARALHDRILTFDAEMDYPPRLHGRGERRRHRDTPTD